MKITIAGRAVLLASLLAFAGVVWGQDQNENKTESKTGQKAEHKGFSAGFDISDSANVQQIGLPIYPGSTPSRSSKKESAAANLSVWAGAFGAKLIVMKLETADNPEKVASYYQNALGKYGSVLDCSKSGALPADKNKTSTDNSLSCESDGPAKNGKLYKAGSKHMQHIVGIEPYGSGTRFQLLYLEAKGPN